LEGGRVALAVVAGPHLAGGIGRFEADVMRGHCAGCHTAQRRETPIVKTDAETNRTMADPYRLTVAQVESLADRLYSWAVSSLALRGVYLTSSNLIPALCPLCDGGHRGGIGSPKEEGNMRIPAVVIISCGLASCGIAAKVDARNDYRASVAAYRDCLITHAPKDCEGLRLAMEADERQYNNLSAGITPGGNRTANINIQGR
jgi:hypothetical protein